MLILLYLIGFSDIFQIHGITPDSKRHPNSLNESVLKNLQNENKETHWEFLHNLKDSLIPKIFTDRKVGKNTINNVTFAPNIESVNLKFTTELKDTKNTVEDWIEFDLRKREDAYRKTDPREFPYAVSLMIVLGDGEKIGLSHCSGSLITPQWVLTSAHCVTPTIGAYQFNLLVYAGGISMDEINETDLSHPAGTQLLTTKEFYTSHNYDIALIRLDKKFNMTETVKTINISSEPWDHRGYRKCVTTGFGIVSSDGPNKDDLSRKTHDLEVKQPCLCAFMFNIFHHDSVASDFLCARPRKDYGICSGDSGGGLVCDGQIVGVNMKVIMFYDVKYCEFNLAYFYIKSFFSGVSIKCGGKNSLSVFQSVFHSMPWIKKVLETYSVENMTQPGYMDASVGVTVCFELWFVLFSLLVPLFT